MAGTLARNKNPFGRRVILLRQVVTAPDPSAEPIDHSIGNSVDRLGLSKGGRMPEPGEVKEGLVWTGTSWVPLRPAVEPSLKDDPNLNTEHAAMASDSQQSTSEPGVNCPVCKKHDRLVRIGGLLDSSTSSSTSYSMGTGVGAGSGGIGVGVGDAITETQSSTRLAQRFEIPKPPLYAGLAVLAGIVVIALIGGALSSPLVALLSLNGDAVGWVAALLAVAAGAWWYFLPYAKFEKRWTEIDNEVLDQARLGYYCERDSVAFSQGHPSPALPEDFIDHLYAPYVPQLRQAIEAVPLLKYLPSARRLASGKMRFTAPPKS